MKYDVIAYCWNDALAGFTQEDAQRLTHVNLAFGLIEDGLLDLHLLKYLHLLPKLREWNPEMKIVLSVGGWGADGFSLDVMRRNPDADNGVTELMVVTGGTHAGEFLRLLGNGHEYGIDRLLYAYQERPGGIAEALGLTERFVDGDRVVVLLADNVFEQSVRPAVSNFLAQPSGARLVLARIDDPVHLRHLGVPELDDQGRVVRILEKPDDPPSNHVVTGVYFYDERVVDVVPAAPPGWRDHRLLPDAPKTPEKRLVP